MAINPEISLGVRPPVIQPLQILNPLEQYAKVQSLRNLMTQGQLGQMNLEQTQLENEAKQRQAQEEQSLGSWMKQNQGRPDLTPQEIVAAHPNPTGIKVATAWSAQQTAALAQRKAVLDAAHEEAKTDDRLYNSVTDDQTKAAVLADLVKLKRIDASQASHLLSIPYDSPEFKSIQQRAAAASLDRLQRIQAEKDATALRIAQNTEGAVTQGAIADSSKKRTDAEQAQVAFDAAKLAAAYDQSPEAGAAALAALDPERAKPFLNAKTAVQVRQIGLTPHEQATAQQAADTAAATEKQHAVQNEIDRARLRVSQGEQALRQRTFDATYGALVDPTTGEAMDPEAAKAVAMQDPVAVGIANYQAAPPSMSRGGPGAGIMRKVLAINPEYNAQNWQAQGTMLKNATSGKMGNELRAANTALSHVGLMYDAIDALNNGDLRALNSIGNRLGIETGKTPAAVFQVIAGKVGPELAQAYGEATGGERKVEKGNFDANLPPQTLRANIAATAELLGGKIRATKFQFQSTPGFEKRELPMISPEAQAVLTRVGGGGAAKQPVKMKAPDGSIQPVPADQVEHYKAKGAVVVP